MKRRIHTAGDARDERARADAADQVADRAEQIAEARRRVDRTAHGYQEYGGEIRRLARWRAGRRLRELIGK